MSKDIHVHGLYGEVLHKLVHLQEKMAWYRPKDITPEQIELLNQLESVIDELEELYDTK